MFTLYPSGNASISQDSQGAKNIQKDLNFINHQGNVYQNHNTGQEVARQVKVPAVNPQILL